MLKILILEYNKIISDVISNSIASFSSFPVDIKSNHSDGKSGLADIFISKPDILIIDTKLPEYSGVEVIDYLNRNINEIREFSKMSVIILDDGSLEKYNLLSITSGYTLFNKKNKNFLPNLFNHLNQNMAFLHNMQRPPIIEKRKFKLASHIVNTQNFLDTLVEFAQKAFIIKKSLFYSIFLFIYIYS